MEKAERQRAEISLAIDKEPQLKPIVEQLEAYYEARTRRAKEQEIPRLSPEVERFLWEIDRRFG